MAIMASDKRLYTELILLYKDFGCLWDIREVDYSNREAKDHAYEVLLEKFREIEEGANIVDLKKKIEHMRAAYRREHKKVLLARMSGGEEYTPHLWYYELLTFLNDISDFSRLERIPRGSRKPRQKDSDDYYTRLEMEDSKSPLSPPKRKCKRTRSSPIYMDNIDSQSSPSDDNIVNNDDNETPFKLETSQTFVNTSTVNQVNEWESFGTTVGLQLKDLEPSQRMIAEKLISDVIFDARFNKLSVNSTIVHQ